MASPELEKKPFLGRVIIQEACWIFTGAKQKSGHGMVAFNSYGERYAHRLMYKRVHGDISPELNVLHSCNNPACVNPDHLRLGTHADNALDRVLCKNSANNKLTQQNVVAIRNSSESNGKLSVVYNVTPQQIGRIKNYRQWRYV